MGLKLMAEAVQSTRVRSDVAEIPAGLKQTSTGYAGLVTLLLGCTLGLSLGCSSQTAGPEVTLEKAGLLVARGRVEDAIPLYSQALKTLPGRADIYFSRGLCYERLNLNEKALEDYTRCLELDPGHVDAMNNKGVVLANLRQFEAAAIQFTELIGQTPQNVLALRNRGLCYHDLGRYDEAAADYQVAIEIDPEDAESWFQRGNVKLEQGQFADAETDYSKAIKLNENHPRAWMNRGVVRYRMGRVPEGIKDLEHARELDDRIVIPGIDWMQAATVTEVVAARPVLEPQPDSVDWHSFELFTEQALTDRGYTDIKTVVDLTESRCARLEARHDGNLVHVFVGLASNAEAADVIIPGMELSEELGTAKRALLIAAPAEADDEAADGFSVVHFADDWLPDALALTPVTSRLRLAKTISPQPTAVQP